METKSEYDFYCEKYELLKEDIETFDYEFQHFVRHAIEDALQALKESREG